MSIRLTPAVVRAREIEFIREGRTEPSEERTVEWIFMAVRASVKGSRRITDVKTEMTAFIMEVRRAVVGLLDTASLARKGSYEHTLAEDVSERMSERMSERLGQDRDTVRGGLRCPCGTLLSE
jgi:hypothetical protein